VAGGFAHALHSNIRLARGDERHGR
jgi:hypothetical protein